jgi:GNAT superfamily N-acetyltransferase
MALSDILQVTEAQIQEALALSAEPGWNETERDWRFFVRHGTVFGLAADNRLVASAACLPYGGFGYLSMVLVTAEWRHRGLATRLVRTCLNWFADRGEVAVLDATPAGQAVYGRLGFQPVLGLDRWEAVLPATETGPPGMDVTGPHPDLALLAARDAAVFGADRRALLADLLARPDTLALADGSGLCLARRGHRAVQVGPLLDGNAADAIALLRRMLVCLSGPVFLDVPSPRPELTQWLGARGFRIQRSFTRMVFGRGVAFGQPDQCFAAAGPEFG